MAARERHRDKRLTIATRRISWPAAVLAGGVLLSLSANLAQAQPTPWGQVMAATPSAAFLVAVSMFERRAATRPAVPEQDGSSSVRQEPSRPIHEPSSDQDGQDGRQLAQARRAAADYEISLGRPITRDALRARLNVSNQAASDLLRQIRADRQAI